MTKRIPEEVKYLRKAKKLLEKPKAWTRYTFARDIHGRDVEPASKEAVCWCAVGAAERVCPVTVLPSVVTYLTSAVSHYETGGVEDFNDNTARDKRYVLRAYDRAIKLALNE